MNLKKFFLLIFVAFMVSCHSKIKERNDEIYSRHLQKHISLTIISTPPPANKSDFNLLLLNDGLDMKDARVKNIFDSLYKKKLVKSLIIVGINAFDPAQQYGVADFTDGKNNGDLAAKYGDFIVNELLPFIKKKAAVRSFRSVTIAGSGRAGISALDIAWDNWQKFDNVGFLPALSNTRNEIDFSTLSEKISKSRKRPKIRFWLDQDQAEDSQKNDSTGMGKLLEVLKAKGQASAITLGGNQDSDSFAQFLIWLNKAK
jgi:predicted alpha/beta superfamily hydrolase